MYAWAMALGCGKPRIACRSREHVIHGEVLHAYRFQIVPATNNI